MFKRKINFPNMYALFNIYLFLKILFIFGEGEGEREGEKHRVVPSCVPPAGDLACNPGVCPDWESNQPPFGPQAGAQSTEPHQPGLHHLLFNVITNLFT